MEEYLHGRCHLFALALHEVFGYPIEFFWETDYIESDGVSYGEVLIHAYVHQAEYCVDVEGHKTREMIRDDFDWNEPVFISIREEKILEMIAQGDLEPAHEGEMEMLISHIRNNLSFYQIGGNA